MIEARISKNLEIHQSHSSFISIEHYTVNQNDNPWSDCHSD